MVLVTKRDGLHLRDVDYDSSADMYSIGIGVKIDDEDGNFIGVMKAVLNIEGLVSIIEGINLIDMHKEHKDMHFRLITKERKIIFSTKDNEKFMDDASRLYQARGDLSAAIEDAGGDLYFDSGKARGSSDMLVTRAHSSGYRDNYGLGWILIMEHDEDEIFAPIIALRNQILTVSLAVTLLAIVMGISLSVYITKSFKKLRDYTSKVGMGDLEASLDVDSKDEIGQLARAFKQMTVDLKFTTVARDELAEEMGRRKLAEDMIHDNEERFRSVAESASDSIISIDSRGEIILWNQASEKIFGYSADEVVGRNVEMIIPERYIKEHVVGLDSVMKSEKSEIPVNNVELHGLRKDGSEFPLEMSISKWEVRGNTYLTAILRDISSRKHSEEIIRNQIGRLNALRSIDRAIIASLDLNVTLDVFLTQVVAQLGIDAVSILLLNKNTHMLEYVINKGFRSSALKYTRLRLGESNAGRAAIERRIVTIPNLGEDIGGFSTSEVFMDEDFVTYIAVPLIAKGQVKGVIELFHRSLLQYDSDWLEFLEAIADQGAIAIDNSTMFDDLQQSNIHLMLAYDTTLEGWSRALDLRDKETEGHSQRVTEITMRIAQEFQIKDDELVHMRRGALLHDIGKMGIPDSILLKPGKLTEEEWKTMKLHPVYARDLLYPIEHLRPAIDIPYYHHEKWDGTGYPEGLRGEKIPLAARIFALVDVWDALRSDRPYRPAWPEEKVRDLIRSEVGIHFDAGVVEVFLGMDSISSMYTSKTNNKEGALT